VGRLRSKISGSKGLRVGSDRSVRSPRRIRKTDSSESDQGVKAAFEFF